MAQTLTTTAEEQPGIVPDRLRGALLRYRILAYTVGVGLIVLVLIGIPLQIWGHNESVATIVGILHGYLYMVYVVLAFWLTRKAGWSITRTILILLAGTVPFLSFVCERYVTRWVREGR